MNRILLYRLVCCLALASPTMALRAEETTPTVEIRSCVVFSERLSDLQFDCSDAARKACSDSSFCELPIGLNLTGGKDIDGDVRSWELVKVEYSCGGSNRVNGPHYQNDHATMTLSCHH